MSEYLKQKMIRRLKEATKSPEFNNDDARHSMMEGGINNLKGSIAVMDIPDAPMPQVEKPKHEPRYKGAELAEIAVDMYRMEPDSSEKKKETLQVNPSNVPSKGQREHTKAVARSLAGLRNGGNEGRPAIAAGPNGGNTGAAIANPNYNMSMEEYTEHIHKKFGLIEDEEIPELEEPEKELLVEKPPAIEKLEQQLLQLEDTGWQYIDTLMRGIAKEHGMTPKELHKAFKKEHSMIPDQWVKEQVKVEECGWFPLDEAKRINKVGNVYEVAMFWKGDQRRVKFFWPEMKVPTRPQMLEATQKFYPGSRMLAYYLTHDDDDHNFMVLVPPMTEHYNYTHYDAWNDLTPGEQNTYNMICEEEGEPLSAPMIQEDGSLLVMIEDYVTGETKEVRFGEQWQK